MRLALFVIGCVLAGLSPSAGAQEQGEDERPFCSDRPGINSAPCTMAPGRVMLELSAIDRTRDGLADMRIESLAVGDTLVRVGVTRNGEARLGFVPLVRSRSETGDKLTERAEGTGDLLLGWRQSLAGVGGPVAIEGFVTLPTGSEATGAGTWTAGVLLPASFAIDGGLSLAATPQVAVAANGSGDGRHLFYGSAVGLAFGLADDVGAIAELAAYRDDDPADATTQLSASGSLAWQADENRQVDAQVLFGLTRDTPDFRAIIGLAQRF